MDVADTLQKVGLAIDQLRYEPAAKHRAICSESQVVHAREAANARPSLLRNSKWKWFDIRQ